MTHHHVDHSRPTSIPTSASREGPRPVPDRTGAPHRVVVVGSGFGGLFATKELRHSDVEITLVDRTTHHLFQPLLYQVATGVLSQGEIAPTTREILAGQRNARVILGEVTDIDLTQRTVTSSALGHVTVTPYDSLVVAAGAGQSYFGSDHFSEHAPGLKTIDDALELRGRIYGAFELAELAERDTDVERLLTFVVVGAGPTGVEIAGQIAELARRTLRRDFRRINTRTARVLLLDAAEQVLPTFGERLGHKARAQLEELGVELRLGTLVVDVDGRGLEVQDSSGSRHRIEAATKLWAAGVQASPLSALLAGQTGATLDRSGRIGVDPDLTLPGHPEVFAIGDMAVVDALPGVAQVAIQQGRYAARQIHRGVAGSSPLGPFRYRDKGSMATISRFRAVAQVCRLRLTGFPAWFLWMVVHLGHLNGFRNQVTALWHWTVSFVGRGRSERAATAQQVFARAALARTRTAPEDPGHDQWAA